MDIHNVSRIVLTSLLGTVLLMQSGCRTATRDQSGSQSLEALSLAGDGDFDDRVGEYYDVFGPTVVTSIADGSVAIEGDVDGRQDRHYHEDDNGHRLSGKKISLRIAHAGDTRELAVVRACLKAGVKALQLDYESGNKNLMFVRVKVSQSSGAPNHDGVVVVDASNITRCAAEFDRSLD